ncbi:hypothetical protein OEZ86_004434 [Tetradesmus obliquus]|nr:hypothetical protein OEZ86_004434 [Tetradesmus obliquus]
MMAAKQAILSLVLLALALGAAAHGGTLHPYPGTPSGSNYIRTKIASCSSWVPASGAVKYSLVNAAANISSSSAKPVVKGDVTVWTYLYGNCSLTGDVPPSAGVEVNLMLTQDGRPFTGVTVDGVAMTGTCASGGGSPYYFNPAATPLDNAENLLWFHNATVPANGSVRGNGANDGIVSTLPAKQGIRSVMLVNTKTRESLSCCDLTLAGPTDTDWAASLMGKGKPCEGDDDHSMHGAATRNGTVAMDADVDHSGHAHDHTGHDHDNMTTKAAAAPAAAARSSAGAASAGAAAAVAAAVLAVAVLL